MGSSKTNAKQTKPDPPEEQRDSGEESEDESEVLGEESPCGRWQKIREEVRQRDVPGIDSAFLAMDREEGTEVVWNEVLISENKASVTQLNKIKQVFDHLTQLDHANIVRFHKYWTDRSDRPRVIFITEYMSSGSVKQFLEKTKNNNKPVKVRAVKAWHKWCTQILSALSYLHSCDPPIVHGNLTCDTIFLQHNGLIKIGSVAPDAIYSHVKTLQNEARNMHYIAPELQGPEQVSPAVDIYAFGICVLEMAVLGIAGIDEAAKNVTEKNIEKALNSLGASRQKDFIQLCLEKDPRRRPTARELLFHPVLFEVHSLRLMAAHTFLKNAKSLPEDAYQTELDQQNVVAEMVINGERHVTTVGDINLIEMEKFLEDVKNGVYPLTAFAVVNEAQSGRARAVSPEVAESVKSETPEPAQFETRTIINMQCQVKESKDETGLSMIILLRMDDNMNRNLQAIIKEEDTPDVLADELVQHGLICGSDRDKIAALIQDTLQSKVTNQSKGHGISTNAQPQIISANA